MSGLCDETATALAGHMASGEASSEEVTRAHLDRIAEVDGPIRAFTVVMRDEALASARRADEERRRGRVRGPLHGMPVSVKESIDLAGHASTLGVPARRTVLATADSALVTLLREAGAVILGRTNVSQLLLYHESRNPVYGQTANPWSLAHTPGGSSGGEAAAVAAGMSPLGIGTDIGGSIRVPAHFTGIAGLKPTLDRWPNLGCTGAMPGQEVTRAQIGPLARTVGDLELIMGGLDAARMTALDPRVPPLRSVPREDLDLRGRRVGHYADDGLIPPSIAVARAVSRAAEALAARGAELVPFAPPDAAEAVYTYFEGLSADGGDTAWGFLGDAPADPTLRSLRRIAGLPDGVRRAAARLAGAAGQPRMRRLLESIGEKSVAALWRIIARLRAYRVRYLEQLDQQRIDLVICPAHATPALPHGMSKDFAIAGSHSMLYNLLQLPAGVVPVTTVRPDEARRERPGDLLEKRAAAVDRASAGLPVGVQVVARPWQDERVLAAMAAIEAEIAGDAGRPRAPVPAGGVR